MTWWKHAVFYEIYLRSFQDSTGDGIGDLNGVTARLDYLAGLGVNALWLTPFYPSPQIDFGYDVSDHEDVDPPFGTLADFDRLVSAAHGRGIKVIIDIVLNHTSDQHPWFVESRASHSSPLRDWYIWRDGAPGGGPPNNWESAFGGPAWTFDPSTGQWYYHFFYAQQPDLNWRHPAVEQRMFDTVRFWMDRHVDGFRLDAIDTLFEDPELRDNPALPAPRLTLTGVRTQDFVQTRRLPEVHEVLRRLRTFVDAQGRGTLLISEAYVDDVADLVRFYGDRDEIHLPFNFFLAQVPALDASGFRMAVELVEKACGDHWPSLVLSNHDIDRAIDRLGGGADTDQAGRLLAMLLLTLRGSPFIYYGEEIGMRTQPPARLEDVRDPVGRTFWPQYRGRDGVRRPMAWDTTKHFGFTTGEPWLGTASDGSTRNVAAQASKQGSLLNFYRELLTIRRHSTALREGQYRTVPSCTNVFAYLRHGGSEERLVVLNMGASRCAHPIQPDGDPALNRTAAWTVSLGTHRTGGDRIALDGLRLEPYEAVLLHHP